MSLYYLLTSGLSNLGSGPGSTGYDVSLVRRPSSAKSWLICLSRLSSNVGDDYTTKMVTSNFFRRILRKPVRSFSGVSQLRVSRTVVSNGVEFTELLFPSKGTGPSNMVLRTVRIMKDRRLQIKIKEALRV